MLDFLCNFEIYHSETLFFFRLQHFDSLLYENEFQKSTQYQANLLVLILMKSFLDSGILFNVCPFV